LERVAKIESGDGSLALDLNGKVYQWGPVSKDNYSIIPTKVTAISDKAIDCSVGSHSFAVVDDRHMVWVWGLNKHSQLGLGDYAPR
jgi:alpha-tubulin suppressor-like RCC1 family protein